MGEVEVVFLGDIWRHETGQSINTSLQEMISILVSRGTYRPPMKWRPLKNFTKGFGAVKLTRTAGLNVLPRPDFGGPSSMFQDDGASTDVTGSLVSSRARITAGNGSRTSPEKLKPADGSQPRLENAKE